MGMADFKGDESGDQRRRIKRPRREEGTIEVGDSAGKGPREMDNGQRCTAGANRPLRDPPLRQGKKRQIKGGVESALESALESGGATGGNHGRN